MDDQLFITTVADGGIQGADGTPAEPDTVARSADFAGIDDVGLGIDDTGEFYPHSGGSGNGDFTITCFIRPTHLDEVGTLGGIFVKGPLFAATNMFSLYSQYSSANKGAVRFKMSDGTTIKSVDTAEGAIDQDTWHFIEVQYNGDTDTLSLAIDRGTPVTTTSVNAMQEITATVRMGTGLSDGIGAFKGQISMLSMWNIVLDSEALDELYGGGTGILFGDLSSTSGLKHYLELDEVGGTRFDSTPNEANLLEVASAIGSSLNVPS